MWAIILNFHRATHVSLSQNDIYGQKPEKKKKTRMNKKRGNINA